MKKKTLVVGVSEKTDRYANMAVRNLQDAGQPIIAFGFRAGKINETPIVTEFPTKKEEVHTVTLYLSAKNQVQFYDKIIALNPDRVIFNPGTQNSEFEELLAKNKITFESACTLVMLSTGTY